MLSLNNILIPIQAYSDIWFSGPSLNVKYSNKAILGNGI